MRNIYVFIWLVAAGLSGNTFAQSAPQLQWAFSAGNPTPSAAFVQSNAIAVDAAGNRYITGRYTLNADFDPSPAVFNLSATYIDTYYRPDRGDVFFAKYDPDGHLLWAKTIGGPDSYYGSDSGFGIILDNSGNILIIGKRGGIFDFDPSEATAESFAEFGIFVTKYDSDGNYLSSFTILVSKYNSLSSFTTDTAGNIYLTGSDLSDVDFDPSEAIVQIAGGFHQFVAKYTASGNFVWVKPLVATASTRAIAADTAGNIYLTGQFLNTVDFDPSAATANLTSHTVDFQDGFIAKYDGNGNYIWAKDIGGTTADPNPNAIAVNASGQVHIIGAFSGTVDFDPGTATNNLTATSEWNNFMAKYDTNGNHLWANSVGAAANGYGFNVIKINSSGLIHIAGNFRDTVDFDPSAATANLTSQGERDVFMAQYNTNGNYIWAKASGGTGDANMGSIALDSNGNINSTGNFSKLFDFDPSGATQNLSSIGNFDIFISKYSSAGAFLNAGIIGGYPTGDFAENENKVALGPTESIYVAGVFSNIVDFDPSPAKVNLTALGQKDIFIAKYTPAGNYSWAKSIGGVASESMSITALTADTNDNVYITGYFYGTVDFDPSPNTAALTSVGFSDIFIAKYGPSGNYLWAKLIQKTGNNSGTNPIKSIAADANGNIYISGYFEGSLDFDPSPANAIRTSTQFYDIFMAKYDSNGNYLWANAIGGNWYDRANAMCLSSNGDIYITGPFADVVDFDPSAGTAILDGGGLNNMYFAKYNSNGGLLWVKGILGLDVAEFETMAINANNQLYLSGRFVGSADFDPSAAVAITTSSGSVDHFIAKYDGNGNYLWAKPITGDSSPYINAIVADSEDNLIMTGEFGRSQGNSGTTITFDPTNPATTLTTTDGRDLFLAKFNGSGTYLWAKSAGSVLDESGSSMAITQNDEMVLTGSFMLTTDFDFSTEVSELKALNSSDMFLATYKDCSPTPVTVTLLANALTVTTPADSYQWIDCNNNNAPVTGATNASFTPTVSGNYAAMTRFNGCRNTSSCQTFLSAHSALAHSAKLYPNPTTGICTIKLPTTFENTTIRVTDVIGKIIKKENFKGQQEFIVSLEEAAKGIYWVHLQCDEETAVFKVIKN
ncbi:T9SS type A sorting domain-containing protein [Flavobacterium sp. GT3R68]|uniref:T9SS type A sorting domain-containing protein n=1 Tax=Flavobacterium sp. GT3R68 TaxID=2594437 RepID=UPI000F86AFB0|nr:T9SS type A sorting domain-containing protein [Flavobacterium sp. GT3R68]RTY96035.1 T9SS type A sorting domain-containing protein [Flavobacterium sp. GSN2]TRW93808.1 T9SS type A sorting domain-containing protein [Flavobacterium sp. GT3R68]